MTDETKRPSKEEAKPRKNIFEEYAWSLLRDEPPQFSTAKAVVPPLSPATKMGLFYPMV